jgi:hypothetical protein
LIENSKSTRQNKNEKKIENIEILIKSNLFVTKKEAILLTRFVTKKEIILLALFVFFFVDQIRLHLKRIVLTIENEFFLAIITFIYFYF